MSKISCVAARKHDLLCGFAPDKSMIVEQNMG